MTHSAKLIVTCVALLGLGSQALADMTLGTAQSPSRVIRLDRLDRLDKGYSYSRPGTSRSTTNNLDLVFDPAISPHVAGDAPDTQSLDGGVLVSIGNHTSGAVLQDIDYSLMSNVGITSGVVPAPGAALLAAMGLGMVGLVRRRKTTT